MLSNTQDDRMNQPADLVSQGSHIVSTTVVGGTVCVNVETEYTVVVNAVTVNVEVAISAVQL